MEGRWPIHADVCLLTKMSVLAQQRAMYDEAFLDAITGGVIVLSYQAGLPHARKQKFAARSAS